MKKWIINLCSKNEKAQINSKEIYDGSVVKYDSLVILKKRQKVIGKRAWYSWKQKFYEWLHTEHKNNLIYWCSPWTLGIFNRYIPEEV